MVLSLKLLLFVWRIGFLCLVHDPQGVVCKAPMIYEWAV
jgi:hypothetical protein